MWSFSRLLNIALGFTFVCVSVHNAALMAEREKQHEAFYNVRAILKMASQALTLEDRLRVVDQAACTGDSDKIDAMKWEFVIAFPLYRDFKPDTESFSVSVLAENVWRRER